MASLLGTSDLNLKNLLGNGRVYHVPPYQRDYSWREEHWEELWLDLEELGKGEEAQHYMGTVVLKLEGTEKGAERFVIIDGQQRIASLSILILCAIARLNEMASVDTEADDNRERSTILRQNFIGTKDPGSLTESSKVTLNENDRDFYEGTLVQLQEPASERALSDSEKLLWGAFKYFKRRINETFKDKSGKDLANWVNQVVAPRLLFIQVLVQDELSAYTVFETLNARGLELTASDLIKNYLMSLVARKGKGDLKHVLTRWSKITEWIGGQRLPEFIRHYVNSKRSFVRQERLFRHIRSSIREPKDAIDFIRELEKAATVYRALWDPEDVFWSDYPDAADHVRNLVMFGVSQYKPLLLAVAREFKEQDVAAVLRICEIISFRFNMISRLGTHELENRYNEAAVAVHEKKAKSVRSVRDALKQVYVPDEQFKNDFEVYRQEFTTKGKRIIRYILCSLERQHYAKSDVQWYSTDASIEHILPEGLSGEWESVFSEDEHARFVDRLGNYTLLEKNKNKDLGQASFDAKKEVFADSRYGLTQELAKFDEWTKEQIAQRQRSLANVATAVWRFGS